jgi:hypothetical protein
VLKVYTISKKTKSRLGTKRSKMKTLSWGLLLIVVLIFGCENTSNIIDPVNTSVSKHYNKITDFDYELIPLPPKSPIWSDSIFTISQMIDGDVGGRIIMEKYYIADNGDSVSIFADLRIPAGAFPGTETINITVDDDFAAIHFLPSMVFADTLKLFQSFKGLDLSSYTNAILDFVFIDDEGNIELIKKNGVQVNMPQGFVRVQNAKILHFSRYGWVRKTVNPIFYPTTVSY